MVNKIDEHRIALERAQPVAEEIVKLLEPHCVEGKVEIVGSIRRKRPWVHDLDLVLIPKDLWQVHSVLLGLGKLKMSGPKILRVIYGQFPIDVYFADQATWGTLLLIRTGSAENNIRLASIAKAKGWHLKAGGEGLFGVDEIKLAGETERSIYGALEIPWQEPWEREVRR